MELQTLMIGATKLPSMFCHRGSFQPAEAFNCFLVLSCIFFCVAAYGRCSVNEMQNPPEYDACAAFGNNYNLGFSDNIVRDTSFHCGASTTHYSFESVCPNSHSFGFPSTLSGFSYKEENPKETSTENSGSQVNGPFCVELTQDGWQAGNESWSSDYGMFKLINGKVFSCSFNFKEGINDLSSCQTEGANKDDLFSCGGCSLWQGTIHSWPKNSEVLESSSIDGSFSPSIRISPALLDWGHKYLYSPLVIFLTVSNTCNNNILHLYEPFSTDSQLYPCNFSTNSLGPSESALICFVFFPKRLGLSSAHLILQTSSGGFLVEAKGYATESPFGIQSLLGLEISPGGKLSKKFLLFNPFDETLSVEEITAWISVYLGHNFVETEAICGIKNFQVLDNLFFPTIKDRLVVKSDQVGSPIVAIRPHKNWEISPHTSETLIEIDISVGFEGKTFGAFCLHLEWSSQDKSDIVMFPIVAEVDINSASEEVGIFVSATLEGISACDGGETVIIISVRNDASYVSRFVKVIEVAETEIFHVKYTDGLLLFPSFITQVAVIYCSNLHIGLHDLPPEKSNLEENCKLLVLTNDLTSPQIEIPCAGILYMCFGHQKLSSVGLAKKSRYSESGNISGGYVGSTMQLSSKVMVVETAEIDELVLGNWVSHGTTSGISVLEDHEVLFPTIQVGSYVSRWITVKNPSQRQVIMQLVLNLGEIIDECRGPDDLIRPSSSNSLVLDESITPIRYGFSVPEGALTEAYVHPYDHVSFGPIIFYPSNRCQWRGSALIRNNLSGLEWLSLRGFGGSLSLVPLDRSELVHSIEFDLNMQRSLNFSLPYALLHMKEMISACSQRSMKELYARNTRDLPLEVIRRRISGRECGLDGFMVHSCRGFALKPGKSAKLQISYQTDFSSAMVLRDLELVLATGIFLMPLKASFPHDMLSICKKSMLWMRLKKSFVGFLVASLIILVFCCIFPQTIALGSVNYTCKSDTLKSVAKASSVHHEHIKSNLPMSSKIDNLFCSVGDDRPSTMHTSCGRYSEQEISRHLMPTPENHKQTNHLSDTPNEKDLQSSAVQSSDTLEASQVDHVMIETGKERGRRRRRKRKGLAAKLTAFSEVSSSQSGNSTPSSPASPATSATPKYNSPLPSDVQQTPETRTSVTTVALKHFEKNQASASAAKTNKLEPEIRLKCCTNNLSFYPQGLHSAPKAVEIPSICLPGGSSSDGLRHVSLLASTSTSSVALHARAPGSKLGNQRTIEVHEERPEDEYAYDIWGNHFSGIHLAGGSKNVTCMMSTPAENNFDSFFVGGPQTLVTNSKANNNKNKF